MLRACTFTSVSYTHLVQCQVIVAEVRADANRSSIVSAAHIDKYLSGDADTLNAKAAIFAAEQAMKVTGVEVPVMLSVTVSDIGGRTSVSYTHLDVYKRQLLFYENWL